MSEAPRRARPGRVLSQRTEAPAQSAASLIADVILVLIFAVLGNQAHDSGLAVPDIWATAWPFMLGLGLSWLLTFSWGGPHRVWPTGALVVLGTVGLGLALREAFTDGGVQASFVAVALCTLATLLLGRRALSGFIVRHTAPGH